jgi:hypothetical protein
MGKKEAVFILLGQSNAVGHNLPMREEDIIKTPLKNVYGLTREKNQSFDNDKLNWSGYTSYGMNLAEEQDNTYSVANCLARLWQNYIDSEKENQLPNLYIIQIAIGAQGVTDRYMWSPSREKRLIPGKLGQVDISLFPFSKHIFKMIDDSFAEMGKDYEIIGLHWRGGENDIEENKDFLLGNLEEIYVEIFNEFNRILKNPPIVLHKIVAYDRANELDSTGKYAENIDVINNVFERLQKRYTNISIFDVRQFPKYIPNIRCNGIFIQDAVHFTEEVNYWVAESILKNQCN